MTRLSYATHDSQCTKQNMSLIINVEHNHFDPLRSTVYHNNILPNAACTLDHCPSLPAKGTRNTALMSVSAKGISSYTHTHTQSGGPAPSQERGRVWCHDYMPVVPVHMQYMYFLHGVQITLRPHQIDYLFLGSSGSLFVEFSKKNKLVGVVIFMGGAHALYGLWNARGR